VERESLDRVTGPSPSLLPGRTVRGQRKVVCAHPSRPRAPGTHRCDRAGHCQRYDRRRVDGLWMDRDSVDRMVEKLVGWDFQQRCANPCIGADRADLVLAGCAILEAIRAVWPSERLRVADRGLREGILSELMADDGVWRNDGRGRQ